MKSKKLSKEHKIFLKTFLKEVLSRKLTRDEIVNYVNYQFKLKNLEPIYCKVKLSNALSNIRFKEKKSKINLLNINKKTIENKKISKTNNCKSKNCKSKKISIKLIFNNEKLKKNKQSKKTHENTINRCNNDENYKNTINLCNNDQIAIDNSIKYENIDYESMIYQDSVINDDFDICDDILIDIQKCEELPVF